MIRHSCWRQNVTQWSSAAGPCRFGSRTEEQSSERWSARSSSSSSRHSRLDRHHRPRLHQHQSRWRSTARQPLQQRTPTRQIKTLNHRIKIYTIPVRILTRCLFTTTLKHTTITDMIHACRNKFYPVHEIIVSVVYEQIITRIYKVVTVNICFWF